MVKIARSLMLTRHDTGLLGSLLWIVVVALITFSLALYLMQRRLIK
jgi:hypothetical protein